MQKLGYTEHQQTTSCYITVSNNLNIKKTDVSFVYF